MPIRIGCCPRDKTKELLTNRADQFFSGRTTVGNGTVKEPLPIRHGEQQAFFDPFQQLNGTVRCVAGVQPLALFLKVRDHSGTHRGPQFRGEHHLLEQVLG